MRVQFHLDESLHRAIADGLRLQRISVTTPAEIGLLGATDVAQLDFAFRNGRVLITRDTDFLRLHSAGVPHAGIVFWTQTKRTLGQLVRALDALATTKTPEEIQGQVIFL